MSERIERFLILQKTERSTHLERKRKMFLFAYNTTLNKDSPYTLFELREFDKLINTRSASNFINILIYHQYSAETCNRRKAHSQ